MFKTLHNFCIKGAGLSAFEMNWNDYDGQRLVDAN